MTVKFGEKDYRYFTTPQFETAKKFWRAGCGRAAAKDFRHEMDGLSEIQTEAWTEIQGEGLHVRQRNSGTFQGMEGYWINRMLKNYCACICCARYVFQQPVKGVMDAAGNGHLRAA